MLVNKEILKDRVLENFTAERKTKQPIFRWPRDSTLIEQQKTKCWSVSLETELSLGELELYQEEATTQNMGCRVVEAARSCSRHVKRRVWISFDIFMARERPGLEVDGIFVEEGRLQKKKRKRNRKSKSDKKKIGKAEENEESFIHLIQAKDIYAISRTI